MAMRIVVTGSDQPFDGAGQLWRATEGEPAYRRAFDVPQGSVLDPTSYPGMTEHLWIGQQLNPGEMAAPAGSRALLIVAQEPTEGFEVEFADWMDTEHVPALSAVPGVLAARRYEAISGQPRYLAIYHLSDAAVCGSPDWTQAASTSWTQAMRAHTQNRVRALYLLAD